ncbi:MAG: L-threonylcarbamoyladenylate synthase [Halioglobus sp.]
MRPAPPSLQITRAVSVLHRGGVIAYPTEAVWGLGCDPADESAVGHLLSLKRRPVDKGLILVASDEAQLAWLLEDLSADQRQRLSQSWPGPVTWLLPHRGRVPPWIHGDHETVAVRVSDHPVVRALCDAWDGVMVSTSANRAGCNAALHQYQVRRYFTSGLDFVVPGAVGAAGRPSQIRDLANDRIIRP